MKKVFMFLFVILLVACSEVIKESNLDKVIIKQNSQLATSSDCPEYLLDRKFNNYNVTILLDLSSRIDEPNQQNNDSAYIVSIAKTFNNHIKNKKLGLLKDKIQLLFHPTPNNIKINKLSEKLKISYIKGVSKKEWIGKTESLYQSLPSEIYELARQDFLENQKYPGSDIWRFFKDDVDDYSIDECYRNIVIVLTDGYMFFEDTKMQKDNRTSYLTPKSLSEMPLKNATWKDIIAEKDFGFIVERKNLDDLEVLVLGIHSLNTNNPYALDIIKEYWKKWFIEMGVKNYKVKKADIPSNVEKVINNFIEGE
jgi:hypothetical protein